MYQYFGEDENSGRNWGGDVLKNRTQGSPTGLFGNSIGQGIENEVIQTNLTASYMVKHNLFIDASHYYRKRTSEDLNSSVNTNFMQLAFRWNFVRPDFNF
jgi:hypothetical protein